MTKRTGWAAVAIIGLARLGFTQGSMPAAPAATPVAQPAQPVTLAEVIVKNDAPFARREMIEVGAKDLPGVAKPADFVRVRVTNVATGAEVVAQPVDTNGDYDDDQVVFQADLAANSTSRFRLVLGERRPLKFSDFKVYGRFNRERHDDFVWENDKVAFRMYGEALETWAREPLTSSTVDAWVKKTPQLKVNEWYHVDDYHKDHGEGGDFYSAGRTRGCGGSAFLANGQLFVSKNFRKSRVLSRGPIRLVFELHYDAYDVAGTKLREVKRVTLDAGSNFNRFENRYTNEAGEPVTPQALLAVGIKKARNADVRNDVKAGILRTWEEQLSYGKDGFLGCAIVADPAKVDAAPVPELDGNVLIALRGATSYHAGTGWDRSGDFKTMADFDAHVNAFARRLASPITVEVQRR
jgi:hypothetical protein